jgi:hypothetical protein
MASPLFSSNTKVKIRCRTPYRIQTLKSGTITSPFEPFSFATQGGFITHVLFEPGDNTFDGSDPLMAKTARQLREYVAAARFTFDLPLALPSRSSNPNFTNA